MGPHHALASHVNPPYLRGYSSVSVLLYDIILFPCYSYGSTLPPSPMGTQRLSLHFMSNSSPSRRSFPPLPSRKNPLISDFINLIHLPNTPTPHLPNASKMLFPSSYQREVSAILTTRACAPLRGAPHYGEKAAQIETETEPLFVSYPSHQKYLG